MAVGVDIELQVKIDKLRAELEKVPGISAKESKKMAAAWSRDYKRMEADAAKAARAAERSAEKVREGWKSASERTASLFGGVAADISDSILDLGTRFSELGSELGGAQGAAVAFGGAIAAGALAVGFAATALVEFMSDIDDTIAALEQFQGLDGLTDQQREEAEAYSEAMRDLEGVSLQLKASIQTGLAPTMTELAEVVIAVVSAYDRLVQSTGGVEAALHRVRILAGVGTLGLSELAIAGLGAVADEGEKVADTIDTLTQEQLKLNRALSEGSDEIKVTNDELNAYAEALGYVRETYVDLDRAAKDRADAAKAAAEAAKRQAEEEAAAFQEVVDSLVESFDSMVAYEAQLAKIDQQSTEAAEAQRQSFDDAAEGWRKMSEEAVAYASVLQDRVQREQMESLAMISQTAIDMVEQIGDLKEAQARREEEILERKFERDIDRLDAEKERVMEQIRLGKISEKEGEAQIERIEQEEKARREQRRNERKDLREALLQAYEWQKAAALTRAAIDAAANATALVPAFAFLGPLAPAAAAGVAVAQFELTRQAINAQGPPKFATGGLVRDRIEGDHAMVYAEPSEGILTPRGVETVGGRQGLEAINRGQLPGGSGGTMVYLDSRLLGEVVARVVESDQRVTAALERRVGAIPGVRR